MYKPSLSFSQGCLYLDHKIYFKDTEPIEPYVVWEGSYERPIHEVKPNTQEILAEMKALGFRGVCFDCCVWPEDFSKEKVVRIAELIQKSGLDFESVHLTFHWKWTDIANVDEDVRKHAVEWLKGYIKVLEPYHPRTFVSHPGVNNKNPHTLEAQFDALARSTRELCDSTDSLFCVENMVENPYFERVEHMQRLMEKVPNGKVCVDVNHFQQDKPEDAIRRLGDRVGMIHISDCDHEPDRHWLPKEGKNDWNKIIGALEHIDYQGAFHYELKKDAYTFQQVKENYDLLFKEYHSQK